MPPKKKKGKKAPKKADYEPSEAPSASVADLLGADLQSVGGSSANSRSVMAAPVEKKKKKGAKAGKGKGIDNGAKRQHED